MTRQSDDERLRAAFESLSDEAAFGEDCPPADRIWSAAHGELPAGDIERLTAHVAECGACAAAWRAAMEFGPPVAAAPAADRNTLRSWLPLAAMLVLAVGGVWMYRASEPRGVDAPRVPAPVTRAEAPTFVIPLEKAPVQVSAERALTWRGAGDSKKFLRELADALAPYRADDFKAAIPLLDRVADRYPETHEPHFYTGVSRLLIGDASGAIEPLKRAAALATGTAQHDARVSLAAAYERSGDRIRARAELAAACPASDSSQAARACSLAKSFDNSSSR